MAVPSTGTLTMLGIAQERLYNTYGSGTVSDPILMTDLINGGGNNNFPALNTSSPSKPNTTAPHAMNEWYGYDQDAAVSFLAAIAETGGGNEPESCAISVGPRVYKDGSSGIPDNTNTLWNDPTLLDPYIPPSGFNLWYAYLPDGSANMYTVYLVDAGGVTFIEGWALCP